MRGVQEVRDWRTRHQRFSDLVVALLAGAVAVFGPTTGEPGPTRGAGPGTGPDGAALDQWSLLLVAVGVLALVWRRRQPAAAWVVAVTVTAIITVRIGGPSGALALPLLGLYTIGTRGGTLWTVLATSTTAVALSAAGAPEGWQVFPALTMVAFSGAAGAVGVAVRGYRTSLESAEARAQQAEQLRAEEGERLLTEERLRIARELHDVLAHHISVINVQAGVARHLMAAQPVVADAALAQIRESSRTVLSEMSTVLGLLRTGDDREPTEPAPTLAAVGHLVRTMGSAGLRIRYVIDGEVQQLGELAELVGYRVVQESLTNALKHGSGTADLTVSYRHDTLAVTVSNPVTTTAAPVAVGGHGIIGMRERVTSVGGRFAAGAGANGDFVVQLEIPR